MQIINEPWFGIVLGALLSLYFYLKSKKGPMLCEAFRSAQVLGLRGSADYAEHVVVTFKGEAIPQLCVTVVTVWNAGSGTLSGESIVARDPLRIVLTGPGRVLEATVAVDPKLACGCLALIPGPSGSAVGLAFDYLDPGDGFAIRVLHTANPEGVRIEGVLKGVERISEYGPPGRLGQLLALARGLSTLGLIGLALASAFFFLGPLLELTSPWLPKWVVLVMFAVLSTLALAVAAQWGDSKPYEIPAKLRAR